MENKNTEAKKRILKRVAQIIKDYLFDENESYAYINLYFEKNNGEHQHKRLIFGKPSPETPDLFRDEPDGFRSQDKDDSHLPVSNYDNILIPVVVWQHLDGKVWKKEDV